MITITYFLVTGALFDRVCIEYQLKQGDSSMSSVPTNQKDKQRISDVSICSFILQRVWSSPYVLKAGY